jgi:hypothetical protein
MSYLIGLRNLKDSEVHPQIGFSYPVFAYLFTEILAPFASIFQRCSRNRQVKYAQLCTPHLIFYFPCRTVKAVSFTIKVDLRISYSSSDSRILVSLHFLCVYTPAPQYQAAVPANTECRG